MPFLEIIKFYYLLSEQVALERKTDFKFYDLLKIKPKINLICKIVHVFSVHFRVFNRIMSRFNLIVSYKLVCDSVETIRYNINIAMHLNIITKP